MKLRTQVFRAGAEEHERLGAGPLKNKTSINPRNVFEKAAHFHKLALRGDPRVPLHWTLLYMMRTGKYYASAAWGIPVCFSCQLAAMIQRKTTSASHAPVESARGSLSHMRIPSAEFRARHAAEQGARHVEDRSRPGQRPA